VRTGARGGCRAVPEPVRRASCSAWRARRSRAWPWGRPAGGRPPIRPGNLRRSPPEGYARNRSAARSPSRPPVQGRRITMSPAGSSAMTSMYAPALVPQDGDSRARVARPPTRRNLRETGWRRRGGDRSARRGGSPGGAPPRSAVRVLGTTVAGRFRARSLFAEHRVARRVRSIFVQQVEGGHREPRVPPQERFDGAAVVARWRPPCRAPRVRDGRAAHWHPRTARNGSTECLEPRVESASMSRSPSQVVIARAPSRMSSSTGRLGFGGPTVPSCVRAC